MPKKINDKEETKLFKNRKLVFLVILVSGVLSIAASYAWFSTNLNVKIETFKLSVEKNDGLSISLDGINFDTNIEISKEILIDELQNTYPNNTSQWSNALIPVSSNGITNHDSPNFNIFSSAGVRYDSVVDKRGYVKTVMNFEEGRSPGNVYLAFDLFFKNDTDSPISDGLYLDPTTEVHINETANEEMIGLLNSTRIGITKINSAAKDAPGNVVQNLKCNNNCKSIIYEPRSLEHTNLSIKRATKYGLNLQNHKYYDTYAFRKAGGPIYIEYAISGSPYIDPNFFEKQETRDDLDFNTPLFDIPDGITKARMYIWIEGQDIDSLETDSSGAELDFSISFIKDTKGYE